LRERDNDVLLLAGHFLELNRARLGVRSLRLSPDAEQALLGYDWPGNVRELEHVISRAAIKALGRNGSRQAMLTLDAALLDILIGSGALPALSAQTELDPAEVQPLRLSVEACQREQIRRALAACDDNWSAAARLLELDASNLHKLARRLGLKSEDGICRRPVITQSCRRRSIGLQSAASQNYGSCHASSQSSPRTAQPGPGCSHRPRSHTARCRCRVYRRSELRGAAQCREQRGGDRRAGAFRPSVPCAHLRYPQHHTA